MAEQKTNVMRVLDQKKIRYLAHEYPHGDAPVDGETVASLIGKDADCVYKTLVTRSSSKKIYVFVVPVKKELDLNRLLFLIKHFDDVDFVVIEGFKRHLLIFYIFNIHQWVI